MVEVSSRELFDVFQQLDKVEKWFVTKEWTCLGVKVIDQYKSGSDIYCMTLLS